MNYRTK